MGNWLLLSIFCNLTLLLTHYFQVKPPKAQNFISVKAVVDSQIEQTLSPRSLRVFPSLPTRTPWPILRPRTRASTAKPEFRPSTPIPSKSSAVSMVVLA